MGEERKTSPIGTFHLGVCGYFVAVSTWSTNLATLRMNRIDDGSDPDWGSSTSASLVEQYRYYLMQCWRFSHVVQTRPYHPYNSALSPVPPLHPSLAPNKPAHEFGSLTSVSTMRSTRASISLLVGTLTHFQYREYSLGKSMCVSPIVALYTPRCDRPV